MEMQPNILIEQLSILVEQSDSSYMPNVVVTLGGSTIGGLKELKQVTVPSTAHECTLISGCSEVGVAEIPLNWIPMYALYCTSSSIIRSLK